MGPSGSLYHKCIIIRAACLPARSVPRTPPRCRLSPPPPPALCLAPAIARSLVALSAVLSLGTHLIRISRGGRTHRQVFEHALGPQHRVASPRVLRNARREPTRSETGEDATRAPAFRRDGAARSKTRSASWPGGEKKGRPRGCARPGWGGSPQPSQAQPRFLWVEGVGKCADLPGPHRPRASALRESRPPDHVPERHRDQVGGWLGSALGTVRYRTGE